MAASATALDQAQKFLKITTSLPLDKTICAFNRTGTVSTYTDIQSDELSHFVEALQRKGVAFDVSNGIFDPMAKLKRSEMLRIIVQGSCELFEKITIESSPFPDVSLEHKDSLFIGLAKVRRIVNGYLDGLYRPEQNITRAEAVKIVLEVVLGDGEQVFTGTAQPYEDIDWRDENAWYRGYISYAFEKGIIGPSIDKKFLPNDLASRGDVVWIFASAVKYRMIR